MGGAFFVETHGRASPRTNNRMEIINTKRDAWPCVSFFGGTDGNRTSDTRIFSPLLYQLSYGTSVLWLQKYDIFPIRQEKNFKNCVFFIFVYDFN